MLTGFKALDQCIPSHVVQSQRDYAEQRKHAEHILRLLKESERVLDILRPISPLARTLDEATIQKFMKIMPEAMPADFHQDENQDTLVVDPRDYFAQRFPEQTKLYGPAMFGSEEFFNGRPVFIADSINDLAFAAILGGDHRLGHQVVYHHAEDQFYFQDYRIEGFCPTSEAKLGLLVSHYLIECSQECHPLAAKGVLKLRTPQTIKGIITTAKALLEANSRFFTGKDGHRRYIDGRYIEPNVRPLHEVFVEDAIVPEPEGRITLTDCYHKYYRFCRDLGMQAPTRVEFQSTLVDAIRSAFNIGLRHDVPGPNGKQANGWIGIAYRQDFPLMSAGLN